MVVGRRRPGYPRPGDQEALPVRSPTPPSPIHGGGAPRESLGPGSVVDSAHPAPDERAVLVDNIRDAGLADAVEVIDAPLELGQRLLGRPPVPGGLLRPSARFRLLS